MELSQVGSAHGAPRRLALRVAVIRDSHRIGPLPTWLVIHSEKRAAYASLTDFVGWLPLPDRGDREAFLTADANAEMIEQIERFPRVRERAVFVGEPDDIVPDAFGADLPLIRDWTEAHYDFAGHVTGFDPGELGDREALGYGANERACIVAAGALGRGAALLRRVIDAFPEATTGSSATAPGSSRTSTARGQRRSPRRSGARSTTRPVPADGAARAAAMIAELL